MASNARLREFLASVEAFPEPTRSVETKETHISLVFLTDQHVYKFKKPLRLSFLDYSTLQKRYEACLAELHLGHRFGAEVYEGIVAVRELPDGRLSFGDRGRIFDYAVKMHRLPESLMLDHILREREPLEHELNRLLQHLLDSFRKAPKVHLLPSEYLQKVGQHLEENAESIAALVLEFSLDQAAWRSVCSRQSLLVYEHRQLFEERVRRQRIVDGHGDLRPEHIFLGDQVAFIDGVEFSEDLRVLDIADELCFLAVEASRLGRSQFAEKFLKSALKAMDDSLAPELIAFYQSYRAMVRAKVHLIRAQQALPEVRAQELKHAEGYRQIADRLLRPHAMAEVFVVAGPIGSGKSSLARSLTHRIGGELLQTDVIRSELFGRHGGQEQFGEGRYTSEARQRVYLELRDRMLSALQKGLSVVLDGTFGNPKNLELVLDPLEHNDVSYFLVCCACPDHLAMQRIQARLRAGHSESEARPEHYLQHKAVSDWSFVGHPSCRVDTTLSIEHQMHQIFSAMQQQRLGVRGRAQPLELLSLA